MNASKLRNELLRKLTDFYTQSNFALIYPILVGEDILSMSIINFVVTNFAKDHASYVIIGGKAVYISKSYKEQLDEYTKQCFDPFCREPKIRFQYDKKNNKSILTSVAQLNFYKWAIEIMLIQFIRNNHDQISEYEIYKRSKSSIKTTSISSASERAKNKVIIVDRVDTKFMNDEDEEV